MIDWNKNIAFKINNEFEFEFLKKLIFNKFKDHKNIENYIIDKTGWVFYDQNSFYDKGEKNFWFESIDFGYKENMNFDNYYNTIHIRNLLRKDKLKKILK